MCLYVGNQSVSEAARNIVCYKTVKVDASLGKLEYRSVHKNFEYEIGKTYKKRNGADEAIFANLTEVNGEGYHSYVKRPSRTIAQKRRLDRRYLSNHTVVIKCVIPKGTPYYTKDGERASRALKVVSVVDWITGEEVELRVNSRSIKGFSVHRKRN